MQGAVGGEALTRTGVCLPVMTVAGNQTGGRLHSCGNVLHATDLYTWKWVK